jgi:putative ABC transport system permease protein
VILPRLALRNVRRNRRRTLLTLAVVVAGYVALAMAGGFMAQTFAGLADGAIRGGIGHLQVLDPRVLEGDEGQSLEFSLADGEALAGRLRQDPGVAEVLPRIQFMGLLSNGSASVAFLGTGVDPVLEARHMAVTERVRDASRAPGAEGSRGAGGRWLGPDPAAREVVLGTGLARSLGARVGTSLTLMGTTRDGALNAVDVEVVGLQDLGLKEMNDRFLATSLETAKILTDAGTARSRLSIVLKHPAELAVARARIAALCGGYSVKPWTELATFYGQVKMLYLAIFGFMGLVLFLVVLLATANTLLMSVMERLREFGTLRAIGLRPGQLLALLQWEGACLGLAGCAAGLVLTLLLRAGLNALHLQMPAPPGTSHGYELNIHLVPWVYLGAFLFLQAVLHLSALAPGLKAARLRITEALRHV